MLSLLEFILSFFSILGISSLIAIPLFICIDEVPKLKAWYYNLRYKLAYRIHLYWEKIYYNLSYKLAYRIHRHHLDNAHHHASRSLYWKNEVYKRENYS